MNPKLPSVVDVAMLSARREYTVPRALQTGGLLGTLFTDLYWGNKLIVREVLRKFVELTGASAMRRILQRDCPEISPERILSFDLLNFRARLKRQNGYTGLLHKRAETCRIFGDWAVAHGAGMHPVYACNHEALEIFSRARSLGQICIMEQTAPARRIEVDTIITELKRWPDWEPDGQIDERDDPMAEREEREWNLAHLIISPSRFTSESMLRYGVDGARIEYLPYGIDREGYRARPKKPDNEKLNVLFVGRICLLKGVPYLLEAIRHLNSSRLRCRMVGDCQIDSRALSPYSQWIELTGPLPKSRLIEMYYWADVLVFPTLFDSFGMVQLEAMSCGTPVIATPCAAPVVRHGIDGFVVPARDAASLAAHLEILLQNSTIRDDMIANAVARAAEFSVERYGESLCGLVTECLSRNAEIS